MAPLFLLVLPLTAIAAVLTIPASVLANPSTAPRTAEQTVECDILIAGGGLAGTAAAQEGLRAGRTVCLTEITDWVGGQLTAQGTSALDEAGGQRREMVFARGYKEFRQRVQQSYGKLNPGNCWVSASCFLPSDAQQILMGMLQEAAQKGNGTLRWFPNTVIKQLDRSEDGREIRSTIAIQHRAAPGTPPLNTEPLSQVIQDAYRYENSARLHKQRIRFVPRSKPAQNSPSSRATINWFVIDATETGELIALADVPYRLGLDPRSYLNPSSPTATGDPYCTQGFTYTFAMKQTAEPQPQQMPPFYPQYEPYYGYDVDPKRANFDYVFTYRRIWAPKAEQRPKIPPFGLAKPAPGDISMQNWVWGNDYRPGTAQDNLVLTREQLQQGGQLNDWMGGLRPDALRKGEEIALGYYYWLVAGTTDSQLQPSQKRPEPNHRLLTGLDSPMGTVHGLSKYPYIREGRRLIGRVSPTYPRGFAMAEIDISSADFRADYYRNLPQPIYRSLWVALSGLNTAAVIQQGTPPEQIDRRTRSTLYPDSIGIAQYAIDFHPCMENSPPEQPGNPERPGVRQAQGQTYPGQIPLRALIPQTIDNLLVAGKSIATSYSVAAAYRVHSFEWSVGAAAGTTADFLLDRQQFPYELVDDLPRVEPQLEQLQARLQRDGNPIAFPNMSIFNENWSNWRVW